MSSSFSWLDFSEHERRKAIEVIDAFREQDTRDELGTGSIRDAFADLLFPGTSTIQTRARYFLFVPWIYRGLERSRVPADVFAERARQAEVGLIGALRRGGEEDGVIGILAGARLARVPSNVYWLGLARWGIRLFPGSQPQYHRAASKTARLVAGPGLQGDDGDALENVSLRSWHAGLPPAPEGFPSAPTSFHLSPAEAEYLRDRILASAPRSLLALLVGERIDPGGQVPFAWAHPECIDFPARIQEQLAHARQFSEVIYGAALLYNLLLAEADGREELRDRYRADLAAWAMLLSQEEAQLQAWDLSRFWTVATQTGAPIGGRTRLFVSQWVGLALRPGRLGEVADDRAARELVAARERALKGAQARLVNARARELWNGAAGLGRLAYRWPVAQRIVGDILAGLAPGAT